jgi:hypothetical protein
MCAAMRNLGECLFDSTTCGPKADWLLAGRVCRGVPGELRKVNYATFIHLQN